MAYRKSQIANRQKRVWLLVIGYWLLVNLSGCATIKEAAKGIIGTSTKALEDNRENAIRKTFNYDYNTCYSKVKEILIARGSYIYAQGIEKHMIAVYVSSEDTTAVGIFFEEIDANNTQVEVSSLSTYAKEFIAKRVFSGLEGVSIPESGKGLFDAEK